MVGHLVNGVDSSRIIYRRGHAGIEAEAPGRAMVHGMSAASLRVARPGQFDRRGERQRLRARRDLCYPHPAVTKNKARSTALARRLHYSQSVEARSGVKSSDDDFIPDDVTI